MFINLQSQTINLIFKLVCIIIQVIIKFKNSAQIITMPTNRLSNPLGLCVLLFLLLLQSCECAYKQATTSCLCDISDGCDSSCCCDTECPLDLITKLTLYGRCGDDNFGIPMCANITLVDMNINDLYSGLKTIYMVMRRLFCVYRINIVNPVTFYNKSSTAAVQEESITRINALRNSLSLTPANIASLTKKSIPGTCVQTNSIPSNMGTEGFQQCRALVSDTTTMSSNPYLSTSSSIYSGLKIYSMSTASIYNPTSLSSGSSGTSCTGSSCTNIVKYVKLYLKPSTSAINAGLSYVVVGDGSNIVNGQYLIVKYQYVYLNSDGSIGNISNIGYKIGSPLQLLKIGQAITAASFKYYKISNPINLAYRKPDGTCRTLATDPSDQSMIQLKLGRNQFHTCIGSNSLIFSNIKNSIDYIGIMGSSNTVLKDYIQIGWNSSINSADSNNVLLKIYYVKVGAKDNPQYYIVKVNVILSSNVGNDKTLFIEYQEIQNTPEIYIPPPPKVQAYLPNDFLYPFYVAQ